jgi:hypothetical protein
MLCYFHTEMICPSNPQDKYGIVLTCIFTDVIVFIYQSTQLIKWTLTNNNADWTCAAGWNKVSFLKYYDGRGRTKFCLAVTNLDL